MYYSTKTLLYRKNVYIFQSKNKFQFKIFPSNFPLPPPKKINGKKNYLKTKGVLPALYLGCHIQEAVCF